MKNKLHIFGCSHSTGIHCDDIKAPWWKDYIQKAFNLDVYRRQGQSGKNVEYILFDIAERLLEGEIQKDDLVILKCNHLFHKKCLKNWFISSKIFKCMICDDELVDEKLNTIYPPSDEEDEPEYKIYSKFPDLWKLMK